jgi:hypothetical protein
MARGRSSAYNAPKWGPFEMADNVDTFGEEYECGIVLLVAY